MSKRFILTSESVTEGHPDKVCDTVADSILDAYLARDPETRINIEALCKSNQLILSGEITSSAEVDREGIARDVVRRIGYVGRDFIFNADDLRITQFITRQADEIDQGVTASRARTGGDQGAGDQGMMFGYATNETPELMPLPITLAHRITRTMADLRHAGRVEWMRPDGKSQVSVLYEDEKPVRVEDVVVSTQHAPHIGREEIAGFLVENVLPNALDGWFHDGIRTHINPTGSFVKGGPEVDSGLTGRKIIVDTYGGAARHGGGSFSGKDASKVDRSGAYFTRYVARQIVKQGLADKVEIQVAYAIGVARPVSLSVETFGTGDPAEACAFMRDFDFRPAAVIERLDLLSPTFKKTTNYGHFGKRDLTWEQ